jgi:LuxR family maltose regulon positive regulatory protein
MQPLEEQSRLQFKLDELAATKLAPQSRDEGHIVRQDLMNLLDEVLRRRLTIVHAGAGYGKTSLLMQWLKAIRRKRIAAAWLTLEEDEAVPTICVAHMFAAIVKLGYINFDPLSGVANFDEKMPVKSLATAFINTVAEQTRPLVIFLDEYNRAESEELNALFRVLIRNMPRHVHFVIASRWRPEIDIENLRAQNDLVEVSAPQLRFSSAEVSAFLASAGTHVHESELHRLTDRTEGWPIALQMARIWLNGDSDKARLVSDFSGRTTDLARYLSEQVLSALPEETRDFILQTAILDRVNGDVANAVTGRTDGWLMLERLYERDLFLIPESDDRQWFRYHTLFLDFLRDRLKLYEPDVIAELHRRAADWLAAHGMIRFAVQHAQKAGDHYLAAQFLSEAGGWRMIMDGRLSLIRVGIANLPDSVIRDFLPLFLAKAFLLVKDGDIKAAREYFFSLKVNPNWTEQEKTDRDVVEHILSDYADDPASIAEIERVQALRLRIHKNDHVLHAILADSLATRYYEFGLFKQALDACDDAISHYRVMKSFYGEIFLRFTQAKAHLAQGRLDDAETILRATEKELDVRFGEGIDLAGHTSIYLAEVLAERGQLDEAAARLQEALPAAEQSDGWYELYATAYTVAAAVGWANRGVDGSLETADAARALARARNLDRLSLLADSLSVYYLFLAGRIAELDGYAPRLQAFLDHAQEMPSRRSTGGMAVALAVIHIAAGRHKNAIEVLAPHIRAAKDSGDVHQLIMLTLVLSDAHAVAGDMTAAVQALDDAVRSGLFTGIRRPYVDHGRRLKLVTSAALHGKTDLPPDRYRDNFLRDLQRDIRRADKRQMGDGIALTVTELEVLKELNHGFSNKEIALHLGISPNTVKYHMKSLFTKLGVSVRAEAVKVCRERALLSHQSDYSNHQPEM